MVIFHSYVSLPDLGWSRWPAKGSADQLQWDRLSGCWSKPLVVTRGRNSTIWSWSKCDWRWSSSDRCSPQSRKSWEKFIASKKLWRCVKGSETAQFCTVHGRYFSWIHIAWFLGIQILQHFGMALATSLDTQKQRQPHEESLEIKRRHAFMLAGTLLNEYSHLDPGFEENCQNHQKKGETSATKLGLWNFFSRLWAERWSVSCNITSHWSVGLFRSCWESHKINLVNWGPQKSKKVNTFF